jgi:hypothetical protein
MSDPVLSRGSSTAPSRSTPETSHPSLRPRTIRKDLPSSKEDAVRIAGGNVKSLSAAKALLSSKGYLPIDWSQTLAGIALILFQLAADTKAPTTADLIKSVAFLLEDADQESIGQRLADAVESRLVGIMSALEDSAAKVEERVQCLEESAAMMDNVALQFSETSDEAARAINAGTVELRAHIDSIPSHLVPPPSPSRDAPDAQILSSAAPVTNLSPFTYAAITKRSLPASHAKMLARFDERERQVIIDPVASENGTRELGNLSELELLTKATTALEAVSIPDSPTPADTRFVGVRKLAAGGIFLDLNSAHAARWLKQPDARKQFMVHFSALSVFKDHEFRALAEFVPISFRCDDPSALQQIVRDGNIPEGSISRAAWAKAVTNRHATQRVAHLKLFFVTAEAANIAIRNGLYIAGKKITVRKLLQEAQRCAKCQRYGHGKNEGEAHFAKDCRWVHDTCGGCGQHHRKEECTANLAVDSFCVNCQVKGHPAWDRTCPFFIDRCKRINSARKDGDFRYFVTRDAASWETLSDDAAAPLDPPDQTPRVLPTPGPQRTGSSGRGGGRGYPTRGRGGGVPREGYNTRNVFQSHNHTPAPANDTLRPSGPATSTNRTSLGTTVRYKQLTFEETEQRRRSRPPSRSEGTPPRARSSSSPGPISPIPDHIIAALNSAHPRPNSSPPPPSRQPTPNSPVS